jgi:hypothetical protein
MHRLDNKVMYRKIHNLDRAIRRNLHNLASLIHTIILNYRGNHFHNFSLAMVALNQALTKRLQALMAVIVTRNLLTQVKN